MMFVFSDIDECASSPCENDATCEDGVNSYICKCKDGFAGKNCEESKCWPCKRQFRMSSTLFLHIRLMICSRIHE